MYPVSFFQYPLGVIVVVFYLSIHGDPIRRDMIIFIYNQGYLRRGF